LRLGLEAKRPKRRRVRIQPVDMGPLKLDLDKALDLAGELEQAPNAPPGADV
jgi:hypothetical protein